MKLFVPPGATDTHIHIYDGDAPAAPGAAMPGHYSLAMYRAIQQSLGLSRVVVVQPNAYRDDNSLALAAAREFGAGARVIAVVQEGATESELERLTRAGVVGQRFFNLPGGCVPFSGMDGIAARSPRSSRARALTRLHPSAIVRSPTLSHRDAPDATHACEISHFGPPAVAFNPQALPHGR